MALRKKKSLLDQASDYIDQVRPQVESAVATAIVAAEDFYENTARPALVDAKDKAGPALSDAREKAAPYVAEARDKASAALSDARDQAAPLVAQAAAQASELAGQAKQAADTKVAELRGEEKKKGSKLKKLAIFVAIAGAVGFVARKIQSSGQGDNWQSSYIPTPRAARPTDAAGRRRSPSATTRAAPPRTRRSPTPPRSRTPSPPPTNPAEVVDPGRGRRSRTSTKP